MMTQRDTESTARRVEELIRPNIRALAPYSTARDEYEGELGIYLDANENPYENGYNRYPDPHQKALKRQIARIKGVPVERIFIGNGSDEAIDLVYRVFCRPGVDNAVSIAPTYGMYKVAAAINDVEFREVPLGPGFSLDGDALLAAADERTKLLFVCSPNNPSGNSFPRGELLRIVERFPGVVVLDEAYIDFAAQESLLPELESHPNLVILQTLSKAWGMAGLRLGLAFASPRVAEVFAQVKYPYNVNGPTQRIVAERLDRSVADQVRELTGQRERVMRELSGCPVIRQVFPSDANFVLVRVDDPRGVYEALIGEGIIVRDRSRVAGCAGCLRITVGTPEENDRLIRVLKRME